MNNLSFLSISAVWGKVWPILIAILFFGLIIFIHEFGHFIFAKLFKVKVNEFAMGMGPTLLKFQGKETKYALRLFPIDGFCAMEGEEEESDSDGSFSKKSRVETNDNRCRRRIVQPYIGTYYLRRYFRLKRPHFDYSDSLI